jgi:hypothetical protein
MSLFQIGLKWTRAVHLDRYSASSVYCSGFPFGSMDSFWLVSRYSNSKFAGERKFLRFAATICSSEYDLSRKEVFAGVAAMTCSNFTIFGNSSACFLLGIMINYILYFHVHDHGEVIFPEFIFYRI